MDAVAFTASNVLTKKPKTGMRVVKGNWDESDDESNRRNSVEVSGDDTDGDEAEMVGVCIGRHKSGPPPPSREKLPPKWPPETSGASVPAWQRRLNLPSNNSSTAAQTREEQYKGVKALPVAAASGIIAEAEAQAAAAAMEAGIKAAAAAEDEEPVGAPMSMYDEQDSVAPEESNELHDRVEAHKKKAQSQAKTDAQTPSSSAQPLSPGNKAQPNSNDMEIATPGDSNGRPSTCVINVRQTKYTSPTSSSIAEEGTAEGQTVRNTQVAPAGKDALGSASGGQFSAAGTMGDGRVWAKMEAIRHDGPDALERLRTECTNYAVVTALLATIAADAFMNPPVFDEDWQLRAFGVTSGLSVMFLLSSVVLSTIIIIHTNLCCVPEEKEMYLAVVDDYTYPNTMFFYMGVWMTPLWMFLAAIPTYGYGVAIPVCSVGMLLFLFLFYIFMKYATKINTVTMSLHAIQQHRQVSGLLDPNQRR